MRMNRQADGPMTETHERHALAGQVWQQIFGFFMHTRPRRDAVLARLALTPNDAVVALINSRMTHGSEKAPSPAVRA